MAGDRQRFRASLLGKNSSPAESQRICFLGSGQHWNDITEDDIRSKKDSLYIDARVLSQKDAVHTPDSPQDPTWFFDKALKPGQRPTKKEVPGETILKEQDSAKGPNSFFDQIVKRVRGTVAKESSGEEAQALLARAKAKEQATREAEEKLESEMQAVQVAKEKSKAEEQAARELEEKLKAEVQAAQLAKEQSKAAEQAARELEEKLKAEAQAAQVAKEKSKAEQPA
ncbi:MAG: hypothetical protein IH919_06100, partial [Deltaproteobacteria bacterium]|nr:hypothetical protein [Deltaproteobacteria bacterium]